MPISRALENKTPQGLNSVSEEKWPISGAESENETVGTHMAGPRPACRTASAQSKAGCNLQQGLRGLARAGEEVGGAELSASLPRGGQGLPLDEVEAGRPPRKKSQSIHTSHTRLAGIEGLNPIRH